MPLWRPLLPTTLALLGARVAFGAPAVTGVSPSAGNIAGGTPLTIRGSGFVVGATVKVGNVPCTQVKVLPDSVILCVTGARAAGVVSVTVFNSATDSSATNALYTYDCTEELTRTTKADFEAAGSSLVNLRSVGLDSTLRWTDWRPTTGGSMTAGTYYYVVTAVNAAGETRRSVESAGTTLSGGNNAVNLAWTPVSGALTYKLFRTTTSGSYGASSLIATLDTTGHRDVAASPGIGSPPGSNTATGDLVLALGSSPGTTFPAGPAATGSLSDGAFSIARPNGTFLVVHSNNSAATSIYDPVAGTMSAGPNLTTNADYGAMGLRRPNGTFLILNAKNSTSTSIYDPVANTMTAGPATTGNVGKGSCAIERPDGKFLLVHGNGGSATSIYDPVANTMTAGPTLPAGASGGGTALPRPDGTFLIVLGGNGTNTAVYDPVGNTMSAGPATTGQVNDYGHFIQRPDGRYLIVHGGNRSPTSLYAPVANTMSSGPAVTANVSFGGHSVTRADGTFLVVHGGNNSGCSIYDPVANTMTGGPSTPNFNRGGHSLQQPDGRYLMFVGGGSSTVLYDAGWRTTGTYVTEALGPAGLQAWTRFSWVRDLDDTLTLRIRTATSSSGLAGAPWRSVANGGDINAGPGETWLQAAADFARAIPRSIGALREVWGVWGAYFRRWASPALASITAGYRTVPSVAAANTSFAFGAHPLDTWLPADSSFVRNDGLGCEALVAKISTFTAGANTWLLSPANNGPDQVRAQWSTAAAVGPWNDISAYDVNFTIASTVAAGDSVKLYFRIQTPTATSSYNPYASTLTVTAQ